jgi:hypothetical protein
MQKCYFFSNSMIKKTLWYYMSLGSTKIAYNTPVSSVLTEAPKGDTGVS